MSRARMQIQLKEPQIINNGVPIVSGNELAELLGSISIKDFLAEYWEKKPLFIKGSPDKPQRLFHCSFDRAAFCQAALEGEANIKQFNPHAGVHKYLRANIEDPPKPFDCIKADQIEDKLKAGWTILTEHTSNKWLSTFAAGLKSQLNYAGEISLNGSLSPKNALLCTHIDSTSAFFIQCEGRKRFLISPEPIMKWPFGSAYIFNDGTGEYLDHPPEDWEDINGVDTSNFIEMILEPGDVLYMPAGTVHATEAIDEYTVTFSFLLSHATPLEMIRRILERKLYSSAEWRYVPAASCENPGELPDNVKRYFAARFEELREVVNDLNPDMFDLNRVWQQMAADPGAATLASMSIDREQDDCRPVNRKDVLKLSRRAPIKYALEKSADGVTSMSVYCGDKEIAVTREWAPFLTTLLEQEEFIAESAMRWNSGGKRYPWKTVQEYLGALLDQNFIERAAE